LGFFIILFSKNIKNVSTIYFFSGLVFD